MYLTSDWVKIMRRKFYVHVLLGIATLVCMAEFSSGQVVISPGTLDDMFGLNGVVATPLPGNPILGAGTAVAIQPDGIIVAVGIARDGADHDSIIARYDTDGTLDTSFGGTGIIRTAMPGREGASYDVLIDDQGRILVAGGTFSYVIARYTSTGSLDTSFGGGDGIASIGIGNGVAANGITKIAIQADGKIVGAGAAYTSATSTDFSVVRGKPGWISRWLLWKWRIRSN